MDLLFADDHELVRDTICAFLEGQEDIRVSTASDFASALALIDTHGPFDLILLDYTMPGMNGLVGLGQAITLNMGKPVAVISGTAAPDIAQSALAEGAAGFLPKSIPARTLLNAVRFMLAGEKYVPFGFLSQKDETPQNPVLAKLTSREIDVLRGLIDGRSNKEIARDLDLQEVTVKLHVKTLCRKIEARNRTHAAMIGKDAGLN
jgi:DNA-binding NarL/FixJ family response regulator